MGSLAIVASVALSPPAPDRIAPEARITVESAGRLIAISWIPVFATMPTKVYMGERLICVASPGVRHTQFNLDEDIFGVALFTVEQSPYRASVSHAVGRITFDEVAGAAGYRLHLFEEVAGTVLSTSPRPLIFDVGASRDIEIVNFGLSPRLWTVFVQSYAGAVFSELSAGVDFRWRNALLVP